jgi:rhamnulose-1-phosphate aldolase
MSNQEHVTDLEEVVRSLGEAGRRMSEIDATEGAAGNLSVCLRGRVKPHPEFVHSEIVELPLAVPDLAGATLIVSGSGSRLRDIREEPTACLACLEVQADGSTADLRYSTRRNFARLTSEFNSHLGVHYDQNLRAKLDFHAVVHGQPRRLTYLSHVAEYQNVEYLNQHLLRWQPEAIVNLPEGIAVVPFIVPGTLELMQANINALRECKVAIWSKHGLMARSSSSVMAAVDLVEYVETAAVYECMDLSLGQRAQGLTSQEIRAICLAYDIKQTLF